MSISVLVTINVNDKQAEALGVQEDDEVTLEIEVFNAQRFAGTFSRNAPSDIDYYGYEDLDYEITPMLDLTKTQIEFVENSIWEQIEERGLPS